MHSSEWRSKWAGQRRTLASLLTNEKGYDDMGSSGYVNKYRKGEYEVWISFGNPDVWIIKNGKTVHNAESVFASAPYATDKQVKLYEFLSGI